MQETIMESLFSGREGVEQGVIFSLILFMFQISGILIGQGRKM